MIPLGTIVKDSATGLKGMLIHMLVAQDRRQYYNFQPSGVDSETGKALKAHWLVADRLLHKGELIESDLPLEVLATEATDEATGISGMVVDLTQHISGCAHITIQPKGTIKNGQARPFIDVDIRRCTGKAITSLTKQERTVSERKRPSPIPAQSHLPPSP